MSDRKVGRYTVECSNESKLYFPRAKITKGEVIDYYERIAPYMLPYVKDRLMTLKRFPDGINGEGFYQKNTPDYFPSFIKRKKVKKQTDGSVDYLVCNTAATLVYCANQGMIAPHITLSTIDKLNYPDRMIFDFDPTKKHAFKAIVGVAYALKKKLEAYGLVSFVMTTGSRGLHVIVPIKRSKTFDKVRSFAKQIAQELVDENPLDLTIQIAKSKRRGKMFVDYLRNSYGATAVAPYAVRALSGAPIATPISWQELKRISSSQQYTMKNIFRRLSRTKDPWKKFSRSAQPL